MSKKYIVILAILWLLICFFVIQYTYAKYITGLSTNTSAAIGQWKLALNNVDIMNNSDFSTTLNLVFPGNSYYNANCVVPGAIGYFELTVDSSNVTVPFRYTVTTSFASGNDITDMEIIGYSLDGSNTITYLDNLHPSAMNVVNASTNSSSIKVYVQWVDGTVGENLNDIQDTAIAKSSGKTAITANVLFEQIH